MPFLRAFQVLMMMALAMILHAQQAVVPAGTEANGAGGTLSWTLGQVDASFLSMTGGTVAQGVQQPVEFLTVSTTEVVGPSWITLLPNPTNEGITVRLDEATVGCTRYRLMDTAGKLLASGRITGASTIIPLADRPAAPYLIQILRDNSDPVVFRIIKQ